jgi:histone deacetylase complex regulatory component SIN3
MSQSTNTSNTSLLLPQPATRLQEPGQPSAGSIGVSSFDYQERQGSGLTVDYHGREGLGPAMDYVQRIKTRFNNDPGTYKQFLEIIASHKSSTDNVRLCYYVFS